MEAGVSAARNSAGVALLTPRSVAWADRITATNNSNGELYCNSVRGAGLASLSRENISRRFASFTQESVTAGRGRDPPRPSSHPTHAVDPPLAGASAPGARRSGRD